jgi:Protein of unknown function (DUF4239)
MRSYILSLPQVLQPVVIVGSTVIAAFAVALLTQAAVNSPNLELDLGLTSAVYGTLGTIYAVLIAFVVSGVWQSFSSASTAVSSEANALTDLVFIIGQIPEERSGTTRELAKAYVRSVVDRWGALVEATIGHTHVEEITLDTSFALMRSIMDLKPADGRESSLYAQALDLTSVWLDARRDRLRSAQGNTAKALWGLLIAGAFVLFAFHGMFVTHVWAVWAGLLLGFSLIVGLAFYLIFSLDSPFTGKLSAGPEPFLWLLNSLDRSDGYRI